jgi:tetratricopeptide (TPR) repeat protein
MYSSRSSPLHRIRRSHGGGSFHTARSSQNFATVKMPETESTDHVTTILPSPKISGDYDVLRQSVDEKRITVRDARASLSSSLDRLGEYHVRQKEYDDAMDAFAEALHEKRSIFSSALSRNAGGTLISSDELEQIRQSPEDCELHDKAIDEIIYTLRNIGNVHSLRGEQDEAMRYYTEVTNLRAMKTCNKIDVGDDTTTLFSGLANGDEDNSTFMSEINEDVKALDDMFRSISFRSRGESVSCWQSSRKARPLCANPEINRRSPINKRRKNGSAISGLVSTESEPFRRSVSLNFPATGNELSESLETYRSLLDHCEGPNLDLHKETFNSLALRVDLLAENLKRPGTPASADDQFACDLELAVEVYQEILSIQYEIQQNQQNTDSNAQASANVASTLIRMGSLFYKLGNRLEELRMYTEAKAVYCKAFGDNHSFVAGARKNIGMVLAERGEYNDAMDEFEKAKQIYLSVNQGNEVSRDVASAISCMGNVKNRVGELDAALKLYMDAVTIYKSIHAEAEGAESVATATRDVTSTLKVIGMVHAKKGDLDIAMGFFTEAMTILRTAGVDGTPTGRETTASVLTRMGSIHVKKGDLDSAMEHYREAYELTVRNRGTTNHQEIAGILHYIGGIFHKRAEYDEAMNCYQESIRIYHSTLGPGNPTVAGTLVMVGSIHYKRRNLDSAMMFYREALRLNRDAYGLHHPDVAPILKSIGTILTKKGEYNDAYDVFRDVLSIKCTVYGTCHPEVASAYKSLGNVHYKLGELADAERQYRHALSIYRRSRGEDHPDTIAARTTIDHIRYWMKERGQRKLEERIAENSSRNERDDERSC